MRVSTAVALAWMRLLAVLVFITAVVSLLSYIGVLPKWVFLAALVATLLTAVDGAALVLVIDLWER